MHNQISNWAGNLTYGTTDLSSVKSSEDVRNIVSKLEKLKALGSRHCFNDIADSKHHLVGMTGLNRIISIDEHEKTVTVDGGINYGYLCPYLNERGYALHNLASLPHISVAGACITSTHGSGVNNGSLATAVRGLQMIKANGESVELTLKTDGDLFNGAVVSLGALGIIMKLTLAIEPRFEVRQYVFENMPLPSLTENLDEIMGAGYSVSLFTDWATEIINEVWIKHRSDDTRNIRMSEEFHGARPALKNVHPINALPAENCTEQLGIAGPWYERLPHFRMGFTPSSGEELQSEYFVPARHAVEAILAIQRLGPEINPYLLISEIRAIAADDLWMSPFYQQGCVAIHFTWKRDWKNVSRLLPLVERELNPYGARPHWGKLFTMPTKTLKPLYPRFDDFKKLMNEFDPAAKFRNDFLESKFFGSSSK
jgi:alditol oxidase